MLKDKTLLIIDRVIEYIGKIVMRKILKAGIEDTYSFTR